MRNLPFFSTTPSTLRQSFFNKWRDKRSRRMVQYTAAPPAPATSSQLAQFPGVEFGASGVDLDDRASDSDAAIRASLIWFKHRWPGQAAVIEGPEEFRVKVWKIAEEVSVALSGPPPGAGQVVTQESRERKRKK